MESLWDLLPPEIQELVVKYARYYGAKSCPLRPCHEKIRKLYYYDNGVRRPHSWPCPGQGRYSEIDCVIQERNGRYYRGIYRTCVMGRKYLLSNGAFGRGDVSMCLKNYRSKKVHSLDITASDINYAEIYGLLLTR